MQGGSNKLQFFLTGMPHRLLESRTHLTRLVFRWIGLLGRTIIRTLLEYTIYILTVHSPQALESVDEALARLESLLQELYVSNSSSGKEQIKAACSDLEKIRKLKKEAEFLEATFKAKTASLQQVFIFHRLFVLQSACCVFNYLVNSGRWEEWFSRILRGSKTVF